MSAKLESDAAVIDRSAPIDCEQQVLVKAMTIMHEILVVEDSIRGSSSY